MWRKRKISATESGVSWISYKHTLRLITQLSLQRLGSCLFYLDMYTVFSLLEVVTLHITVSSLCIYSKSLLPYCHFCFCLSLYIMFIIHPEVPSRPLSQAAAPKEDIDSTKEADHIHPQIVGGGPPCSPSHVCK